MKRWKLAFMVALPLVFVLLIFNLFTASLSPYMTVSEVVEGKPYDRNVQVIGRLVKESIFFDFKTSVLSFELTDGRNALKVRYEGIVNDVENATEAVVFGKYGHDGFFNAERVFVKCPSKYEEATEKA